MSFLSGIGDLLQQYSANSHPVLIKSLGAAALTIAMKKIADQHAA
jgi:hypothetical protein